MLQRNDFSGKVVTPDVVPPFNENNALHRPTGHVAPIENNGYFSGLSNPDLTAGNENTGALAGATGAVSNDLAITGAHYPKPRRNAMSMYGKDRHKRACRMLGYALTLGDAPTWVQAGAVWQMRLTEEELASVAFAALQALEPDTRLAVFGAAHWEGAQ